MSAAAPPATARGTMPLAQHGREARRRATRAAAALLVGVVVGYLLSEQVLDLLREPIEAIADQRAASLNYDTVTGAFDLRLRIAVTAGVVLSSPVWVTELFGFVSPGLERRERRLVTGYGGSAAVLFAAGCGFGFWLFPHVVVVLAGFSSAEDSTILSASTYVDFVLTMVVATGISFVLPVLVVMLHHLGLVSSRTIRRSWRLIVVVITLFSALVTPAADVLSMVVVALPMTVLFPGAVALTVLREHRAERSTACSA
ncbi:twin-arginine translocase subunit TatC [uncultured Nocardioides sp.]|uniref:twin-arginine translocase subunit TatC n=1 Tax=uncultured Nocardioides sp. TaxID=198441 RepID=UPI0026244EE3|nr:twin-arginine translocase subunit TatC [uncultured Nocardioides sp.]